MTKIGDVFEFKASDMAPGLAKFGRYEGLSFRCRVVSLILKAGRVVGQGIIWECDEGLGDSLPAKVLLNEPIFGHSACEWAWKGKKIE